jgi:DNA mismatch endonuclease (patch repair protein)
MPDMFDKQKRSEIMSRIRSKNTKAELIVFKYLRQQKVYFQKHYDKVAGKPDVALPRKKLAIFIDGDFWHGRKYKETISRLPEVYWRDKIANNIARDKKNRKILIEAGWDILNIWETDIVRKRTRQVELDKIIKFLKSKAKKTD